MKFTVAALFVFFVLSIVVSEVRCQDDDTIIVDAAAASEPYPGEEGEDSVICTDNQRYSRCEANPQCQRTCDNVNQAGIVCPRRSCIEGCICKNNFVRSEMFGGCIPEDQCRRVKH